VDPVVADVMTAALVRADINAAIRVNAGAIVAAVDFDVADRDIARARTGSVRIADHNRRVRIERLVRAGPVDHLETVGGAPIAAAAAVEHEIAGGEMNLRVEDRLPIAVGVGPAGRRAVVGDSGFLDGDDAASRRRFVESDGAIRAVGYVNS